MLTSWDFQRKRTSEVRLISLRVIVVICFAALAVGFWLLQVVGHAKYQEMAANNHTRTIPLRAPRGVVFDRDGRVLVENRYSFTVAIVRERTKDLATTIHRIAEVTGVDERKIRDAVDRRRLEPPFRPLPVIENATFDQVAALTARHLELPAVVVQQVPTRNYPAGDLAAHLFGYVGEVQEAQLNSPEFSSLQPGAIVGQAGLEKVYNSDLMGTDGNRLFVVNSVGREIDELQRQEPVDGQRLQLTIDLDLQRALEEGFRDQGFAGAGILLDPHSGEVLAMTSLPSYDPNDFASGLDSSTWSRLLKDPRKPLTNRLLQGTYSPGSTFKILMATAALSEGIITPDYKVYCPGYITLYGHTFHCDKRQGHGSLDLRHALEQSCDVYFYKLASMMSIDTIHKYAAEMGLVGQDGDRSAGRGGQSRAVHPMEAEDDRGALVSRRDDLGRHRPGTGVGHAHLAGDHDCHGRQRRHAWSRRTCCGRSTVARAGSRCRRRRPSRCFRSAPTCSGPCATGCGSPSTALARPPARRSPGMTWSARRGPRRSCPCRTSGTPWTIRDHSWFVFYAPREHPEVAGVVFVEHGGWGATAAVPIAKHVLETFFAKREGRPLPSWPLAGSKTTQAAPAAPAPAHGTAEAPAAAAAAASTAAPVGRPAPAPATVAAVGTRSLE